MTVASPVPAQVWIVADIHLDADPGEAARARSDAFSGFLERLGDEWGTSLARSQLVVLGDLFDLPSTTLSEARAEIQAITNSHPRLFAALASLVDAGIDLVLVPGNHDIELTSPDVFAIVRRLLEPQHAGPGRIRVVPWVHVIPGLLYAEHGNQYHDINWFSTVLTPTHVRAPDRVHRTSARWLGGIRRSGLRRADIQSVAASLVGLALSLLRRPPWADRRAAYLATTAIPYAEDVGLSAELCMELDGIAERGPMTIARRLVQKAAYRAYAKLRRVDDLGASGRRDQYLRRAVPKIVAATQRHGMSLPYYVFGHTHVAARRVIDDRAVYLNAGTWSGQLPTDRARNPRRWMTIVRITPSSGDLLRWDDESGYWEVVDH